MFDKFDVVVIGGGPGGYVTAIRCAQLGLNTACIEKRINKQDEPALGGTCLNVGCIPSKALLDSSWKYHETESSLADHGIKIKGSDLDLGTMLQRKDTIVKNLTGGIAQLFKANKVTWLQGTGQLKAGKQVEFQPLDGGETQTIQAEHVVLAAGSVPVDIPVAPVDQNLIVDSTGALEFDKVPKRLGVIGAGVIEAGMSGIVWAVKWLYWKLWMRSCRWSTIADAQVPAGSDIRLGAQDCGSETTKTVKVTYSDKMASTRKLDKLAVAVAPITKACRVRMPVSAYERNFIYVDSQCRTDVPGVYAIGDLVRGPALAHKAIEEGVMVAEVIMDEHTQVNYDVIPGVIYTHPEVAWVGKTEEEVKESGDAYKTGVVPFAANGRAMAAGETGGMVKFVADEKTDRILGMHIVGPQASELIHQGVVAMEFGATAEDLQMMVFGHPSLSETVHEAALAVDYKAIHVAQRRRKK